MFELPLRGLADHIIADVDGRPFLVDTGSPLSFGFDTQGHEIRVLETLNPRFRAQPLPGKVVAAIRSAIHSHVCSDIVGVLGMDLLSQFDSHFSLPRGTLTLTRFRRVRGGDFSLPLEPFNGLPVVGPLVIAGRAVRAIWDSGAPTSYLTEPRLLDGYEYECDRNDFHPLSGSDTFRVRVHSVPVELAAQGGLIRLRMALLPEGIDSGGQHILGSELLNYFELSLCLRDGVVHFTRHDNLA